MKVYIVIASTTHKDLHNERMSKKALEEGSTQINTKYSPVLIEHDWDRQIGINLSAMIRELPDGEFALCVVQGIFENEEEKLRFKNNDPNRVYKDYRVLLEDLDLSEHQTNKEIPVRSDSSNDKDDIATRLEDYMNKTNVTPTGKVCRIKALISSIGDLRIEIFSRDHLDSSPHFHIISKQRNINARFNVHTIKYINTKKGTINSKDVKKIQEFFKENPDVHKKLLAKYNLFRENEKN